jgi:hypothetical protein
MFSGAHNRVAGAPRATRKLQRLVRLSASRPRFAGIPAEDEPGPMPVLTSSAAGPTSNGSLGLDPARSGLPETAGDWQLII